MAQNEMKAKPALPERVRSMEGLGVGFNRYDFVHVEYICFGKVVADIRRVAANRGETCSCKQGHVSLELCVVDCPCCTK